MYRYVLARHSHDYRKWSRILIHTQKKISSRLKLHSSEMISFYLAKFIKLSFGNLCYFVRKFVLYVRKNIFA